MSEVSQSTAAAAGTQSSTFKQSQDTSKQKGDGDGGVAYEENSAEYTNRPYKKYLFLPGYPKKISDEEYDKHDDEKIYHKRKHDRNFSHAPNNGLAYYVIDASWIMKWRNFISVTNAPYPGPV